MTLRFPYLAAAAAILLLAPLPTRGAPPRQIKWAELPMVVGETVSIAMPGLAWISGTAIAVETDALVMTIRKTSDPKTYPKGPYRVPRATLRMLEMHSKTKRFRTIGTLVGWMAGTAGGAGAWLGITGGILGNKHENSIGAVALIGIMAAGTAGGYLLGNAADRRSVTLEIVP